MSGSLDKAIQLIRGTHIRSAEIQIRRINKTFVNINNINKQTLKDITVNTFKSIYSHSYVSCLTKIKNLKIPVSSEVRIVTQTTCITMADSNDSIHKNVKENNIHDKFHDSIKSFFHLKHI